MGASFDDCLLLSFATAAVGFGGWNGMQSFSCMGHVCIVLGRGKGIDIFSCVTWALMGLEVGATLGELLVGGCTGL